MVYSLLHGVISLPDATSYDKIISRLIFGENKKFADYLYYYFHPAISNFAGLFIELIDNKIHLRQPMGLVGLI